MSTRAVLLLLVAAVVVTLAEGQTRGPAPAASSQEDSRETVVLLHGLGRTQRSMAPLERALEAHGYRVENLGYPSRRHTIQALADSLAVELEACCSEAKTLHFVTHSLGGILVRAWAVENRDHRIGRVVMLSPPNQGSEVVDELPDGLLRLLMGPASLQLGTDTSSLPVKLPPVDFELGVITGDVSLNPLFSWWIPSQDDGKVSVGAAWVEGTDDFLVVPYSHAFIMRRDQVAEQVVAFLESGAFMPDSTGR
jgi:triacylglycerol lipase